MKNMYKKNQTKIYSEIESEIHDKIKNIKS